MEIATLVIILFLVISIVCAMRDHSCYMEIVTRSEKDTSEIIGYMKRNFPEHKIISTKEVRAEDYYKASLSVKINSDESYAVMHHCENRSIRCWVPARSCF